VRFEVGQRWRTREGKIVRITRIIPGAAAFPILCDDENTRDLRGSYLGLGYKSSTEDLVLEVTENELFYKQPNTTTEREPMKESLKNTAVSLRNTIKPYEKYIIAAAALVAIDYFFFGGAGSERIKKLAGRVGDRLTTMLDKVIDKIGGEDA